MSKIEVLKFGSSVLRSPADLPVAVDEVYRRWRSGYRVLAVVSAFENVTQRLLAEVSNRTPAASDASKTSDPPPEAIAAYLCTGEQQTAALLLGALLSHGLPARLVEPREIHLRSNGLLIDSTPVEVDRRKLDQLWQLHSILILPGFYGIDAEGRTALFGRGGSDLSAIFLAVSLRSECRLLKDVPGVFDQDPATNPAARRYCALSWDTAIEVAGPLIQAKALHYAHLHRSPFEVGRPNAASCTLVGRPHDEWASPTPRASRRLRVALLGCGNVGRGVYEAIKRYPDIFDLRHVVVRNPKRHTGVEHLTTDPATALDPDVDVIVVCFGGISLAYPLIATALAAGKYVVTANKAAIASHGKSFVRYARGADQRLWYSAAVAGAIPALETLATLRFRVREIRGIINGTCGVVLDAMATGRTLNEAVALAQSQGFAEENPIRDLSGQDAADKLSLLIEAAFGQWIEPEHISTHGISTIAGDPKGYKLIARASRALPISSSSPVSIVAGIAPERPAPGSFLAEAQGPENRLEIELVTGEVIHLRGQGAGRWPTTVSVMGDLHEIARSLESRGALPTHALDPLVSQAKAAM